MNKKDKHKEKQDRLAQALRDNLRRRKQQTPAPAKTTRQPDEVPDPDPDKE